MRPIPKDLREQIASDPFMRYCVYERNDAPNWYCRGRITWEHAWQYSGKQINEPWAIIPCCEAHNSGEAMVKDYNRYVALLRADIKDLQARYPKKNWAQELKYLSDKYAKKERRKK